MGAKLCNGITCEHNIGLMKYDGHMKNVHGEFAHECTMEGHAIYMHGGNMHDNYDLWHYHSTGFTGIGGT